MVNGINLGAAIFSFICMKEQYKDCFIGAMLNGILGIINMFFAFL